RVVPGHGQDSDLRRWPGRSAERRHPARPDRPRRRTARLPQVLVRVPHPVPRSEGARLLRPVPVDGAEPRVPRRADDLARDGPREREGRPHHRRPRLAARDRRGPRATAMAPRPATSARPLQGGDGVRPDRPRQPGRSLRARAVRKPTERDLRDRVGMTTDAPVAFVFNLGAALPLVALLVSAFLGAYVFGVNPRGTANRSVLLVMLAFVLWDLGEIVQRSLAVGTSPDVLLFWARFTWVGIALVPATLYHLALTYPTKSEWIRRPWALAAIYAPFVFWAYLIVGTGLIIDGISSNAFGP